ncbi:IPExxxVDY family protein [Aquimarina hainanensis]|uniref:IPExxxVDY family protein n=1 Tax=Aquimarina hainanensis TaxID=1578017 RepID=A0ABW5N0X8_9FLAO
MAVQRLVLDTIEDEDYELIAIHSSIAPYRLAFLLNKTLNIRLHRKKEDIIFEYEKITASFPWYQYEDHFQYSTYSLLGNTYKTKTVSQPPIQEGLFVTTEETYVTKRLIPELKKVDFFLKIETEDLSFYTKSIIASLIQIPQVITAYTVDYSQLKSKNNLIFE